jgi:hypothetical protein
MIQWNVDYMLDRGMFCSNREGRGNKKVKESEMGIALGATELVD